MPRPGPKWGDAHLYNKHLKHRVRLTSWCGGRWLGQEPGFWGGSRQLGPEQPRAFCARPFITSLTDRWGPGYRLQPNSGWSVRGHYALHGRKGRSCLPVNQGLLLSLKGGSLHHLPPSVEQFAPNLNQLQFYSIKIKYTIKITNPKVKEEREKTN